ncbi:MAG: 3-deoxy-D-manno-octulosonic acid transferase [Deltaproteobacteria bacterium]|nr:3-deoxy-D-manno-octulosonic acid transferase [Deltaproteobacteria bacterium]
MWFSVYNLFVMPAMYASAHLAGLKNEKLKLSIQGKRGIWNRLKEKLKDRDPNDPLVWFHVASAGEFLQAQPVMELFLNHDFDCAVTFNSVSGEKWTRKSQIMAKRQPILIDYLPYDFVVYIRRWIRLVKPRALVFVKYDLWPNLIWETHQSGIPIYLISATLHPRTARFTTLLGRSLYSDLYSRFKGILTVTVEDKTRFLETNEQLPNLKMVGDTRYDSVINRRDRIEVLDIEPFFSKKKVLIVGSGWPPDETCVFPGIKEALKNDPDFMVVLAPHEPCEDYLVLIEEEFVEFSPVRLKALEQNRDLRSRVLMVDYVGVLSSLYRYGQMAFIGGGFTTGVHNVMEPAAFGLVVSFGPKHYNSPEAIKLVRENWAFPVNDSQEFKGVLSQFLDDPKKFKQLGEKSRKYVEAQCGASIKCFEIIKKGILENQS